MDNRETENLQLVTELFMVKCDAIVNGKAATLIVVKTESQNAYPDPNPATTTIRYCYTLPALAAHIRRLIRGGSTVFGPFEMAAALRDLPPETETPK